MLSEFDAWDAMCFDAFDDGERGYIALMISYEDSLKFFADASANTCAPLIYTVGGYLGKVRDWRSFRKEWRDTLKKHGFGDYPFHMTDFERDHYAIKEGEQLSRKSPYKGWKPEQFLPFQKKLHSVITRKKRNGQFRLEGFMASVVRPDFERFRDFVPVELRNELGFNNDYMWNAIMNMESVAIWAEEHNYHDPIHYVFASGDKQGGNLEAWFEACWDHPWMRKHYRLSKSYSLMPYSISKMKLEPALQGADVGVYELNKYSVEVVKAGFDQSKLKPRESLRNLAKIGHNGKLMSYDELVRASRHMRKQRKTYPGWPHVGPPVSVDSPNKKGGSKSHPIK